MSEERMFPLQPYGYPGPLKIPWIVAEKAWSRYVKLYGATQTLEVMARRAGFSWGEMDTLYPEWRAETDAVTAITAELAALRARVAKLEQPRCCSVCAGHGDPTSGRECVCGGLGTETAEILGLRATAIEMAARVAELEREVELLRDTASTEARLACAWARKLPDDHWMIRDGIVIGLRSLIALGPRPEGEAQDAR